jgi:hypothetical protein
MAGVPRRTPDGSKGLRGVVGHGVVVELDARAVEGLRGLLACDALRGEVDQEEVVVGAAAKRAL